jgi:hypothetical protein
MKKVLAIGIATLFFIVLFAPQTIAKVEVEEPAPIDSYKYGIALIKNS